MVVAATFVNGEPQKGWMKKKIESLHCHRVEDLDHKMLPDMAYVVAPVILFLDDDGKISRVVTENLSDQIQRLYNEG
jgi:hypothetical protein